MSKPNTARAESWDGSSTASRRITVLVVDDEDTVLSHACRLLERPGLTVLTATSTAEALRAIGSMRVDVALIDWRLTGQDDGLALGRCLRRDHAIPFVLCSGYLNTETTGNAYKQGAADVLDKPLRSRRLMAALDLALRPLSPERNQGFAQFPVGSDSVSQRLARLILKACRAEKDPSTELDVAEASGVSTSVFRRLCRECGLRARDIRDLVRFLRALALSQEDGSKLRSHLATTDSRIRDGLFRRAGLPVDSRFIPLRSFLLNQHFISPGNECLRELAHAAANDVLFFGEFESPEV